MDSDLTLDFIIIVILIIANGIFSMTELAIVNAKKRRLEEMAESGNERARRPLSWQRIRTRCSLPSKSVSLSSAF